MLRQCFNEWIKVHLNKMNKRQAMMEALIHRYKQLFRKSFRAVRFSKSIYYKRKVLKGFSILYQQRMSTIQQFWEERKYILFKYFFAVLREQKKQKQIQVAMREIYEQNLLVQGFLNLRKATKLIKKQKNNIKMIQLRTKELFFDKWILQLQNKHFQEQLVLDSHLFYEQNLLKRCLDKWKMYCLKQQQKFRLKEIFNQWMKLSQKSKNIRQNKYKPVFEKYLKITHLKAWKEISIDCQKNRLATEFYKYKLFHKWKRYVDQLISIQDNLVEQEMLLTLNHMKRLRNKYLLIWRQKLQDKKERMGLVQILLSAKQKQNKLKYLENGFRSLKNNYKINNLRNSRIMRRVINWFRVLKYKSKFKKEQNLIVYATLRRIRLFRGFMALHQNQKQFKDKQEKAKQFYQLRLQRDMFHLMIEALILQYQQHNKLSQDFYKTRRLIFCFNQFRENKQQNFTKQLFHNFIGYKQFKQEKIIFQKLKNQEIEKITHSEYILLVEVDEQNEQIEQHQLLIQKYMMIQRDIEQLQANDTKHSLALRNLWIDLADITNKFKNRNKKRVINVYFYWKNLIQLFKMLPLKDLLNLRLCSVHFCKQVDYYLQYTQILINKQSSILLKEMEDLDWSDLEFDIFQQTLEKTREFLAPLGNFYQRSIVNYPTDELSNEPFILKTLMDLNGSTNIKLETLKDLHNNLLFIDYSQISIEAREIKIEEYNQLIKQLNSRQQTTDIRKQIQQLRLFRRWMKLSLLPRWVSIKRKIQIDQEIKQISSIQRKLVSFFNCKNKNQVLEENKLSQIDNYFDRYNEQFDLNIDE